MKSSLLDRLIGGALLLVLIGTAIFLTGVTPVEDDASAYNARERGRRGVFLLLEKLGFETRAWDGAPGTLPLGRHLLWLPEAPKFAGTGSVESGEERVASVRASVLGHLHHAERYADFLAAGGGMVLADGDEVRRFLESDLGVDLPWSSPGITEQAGETSDEVLVAEPPEESEPPEEPEPPVEPEPVEEPEPEPEEPVRVTFADGEALTIDRLACPPFTALDTDSPPLNGWRVWLEREDGAPLILVRAHGGSDRRAVADEAERSTPADKEVTAAPGRIFLLAGDRWLANRNIGALDHGLLAVRLAEAILGSAGSAGLAASSGAVLFDEYALGGWRPDTRRELAFAPNVRALTWMLFLLALLFLWRLAWPREFPRDPEPLDTISPLARARAQASLLERAGAGETLARLLIAGRLTRMGERLGLPSRRGGGAGEPSTTPEALAAHLGLSDEDGAAWARQLDESRANLEELDACLDRFELRLSDARAL